MDRTKLESCGINVDLGLSYAANSESFYEKVLSIFLDSNPEVVDQLVTAYADQDWPGYRLAVHTLKGNVKTVGAEELGETAYMLQKAAEAEDVDTIKANHDAFLASVQSLMENIRQAI